MTDAWQDAATIAGPPLAVKVEGRGRMYLHPISGEHLPSITSIISVIDKPALVGWAARETAIAAYENRFALVRIPDEGAAVDLLKNARYRRSSRAAKVGTTVHAICEALARDEALPPFSEEHEPYADAFLMFVEDYRPTFRLIEATVFSDLHGYAGTLDAAMELDGRLVLCDWKSGKGIYPEVALQLAAARYADVVWDRLTGDLSPVPSVEGCIAVHLQPDGYQLFHVKADESAFRAFLGARALWPWVNGGEDRGAVGPAMSPARLTQALAGVHAMEAAQ